jgi:hypothetical protein
MHAIEETLLSVPSHPGKTYIRSVYTFVMMFWTQLAEINHKKGKTNSARTHLKSFPPEIPTDIGQLACERKNAQMKHEFHR